jgi:hypothetical protein
MNTIPFPDPLTLKTSRFSTLVILVAFLHGNRRFKSVFCSTTKAAKRRPSCLRQLVDDVGTAIRTKSVNHIATLADNNN